MASLLVASQLLVSTVRSAHDRDWLVMNQIGQRTAVDTCEATDQEDEQTVAYAMSPCSLLVRAVDRLSGYWAPLPATGLPGSGYP